MSKGTRDKNALYGLILAGGQSQRMKQDKSLLEYHGQSQMVYCIKLLSGFCDQVFISRRIDQSGIEAYQKFPQILDQFYDIGPFAGILSAMKVHHERAWLVLACDLPFVDSAVIAHLKLNRNRSKRATVYRSAHDGTPEPLCAIYESGQYEYFKKFLEDEVTCPRKILMSSDIEMIDQIDNRSLDNINSQEEYQNALVRIKRDECRK